MHYSTIQYPVSTHHITISTLMIPSVVRPSSNSRFWYNYVVGCAVTQFRVVEWAKRAQRTSRPSSWNKVINCSNDMWMRIFFNNWSFARINPVITTRQSQSHSTASRNTPWRIRHSPSCMVLMFVRSVAWFRGLHPTLKLTEADIYWACVSHSLSFVPGDIYQGTSYNYPTWLEINEKLFNS